MNFVIKLSLLIAAFALHQFEIGSTYEMVLALALILGLGIPHGGSDHLLYNLSKQNKLSAAINWPFMLQYLGTILVYAVFWILAPPVSLLLFILVSGYHFGETQFFTFINKYHFSYALALSWGLLVLQLVLANHSVEVIDLLSSILAKDILSYWQLNSLTITTILLALTASGILALSIMEKNVKLLLQQALELLTLYFIFQWTGLLLGFAIFFAFWHSRDAILIQITNINKAAASFKMRDFIKATAPFTALSIVGIAMIVAALYYYDFGVSPIVIFFILISLLTLPHIIVILEFYKKTASNIQARA